jgi:thiol-disulfide isomerase/thioredoxin
LLTAKYRPVRLPLALALGFTVILGGCDSESTTDAQPQEAAASDVDGLDGELFRDYAGREIPDFTVVDAEGNELHLPGLKGQPLLVNLWATWCAPCVTEMPMLDAIAKEYDGQLRVVTISEDMKGEELVGPFFQQGGYEKLEPWLDLNNDLVFAYDGASLPTTVLYDADGKELWRVLGGYHWDSEDGRALLAEAL